MKARDRVMTLVRPRMVNRIVVAVLLGILLAPTTARAQEEVVYYHTDAIGSVRMITSETGGLIGRYDYLPFGELVPIAPPAPSDPRQFAGKERDAETGLDYFGARYHRAQSGRFISVDPVLNLEAALIDPQRWNRYSYALNNPLRIVDPDGREPVTVTTLAVTGGIGAVLYGSWNAFQNVRQGRSWYENIGVEASKGFLIGATLGLAAPAIASTTAGMGVLTAAGSAGAAANALGVAREVYVAQLVGGRVAGDVRISIQGVGSTAIDVYGKAGEFIGVGGPMKAIGPDALSRLGTRLKVLAGAAEQAGVKAQYYFARGTSLEAFRLAEKWLGKGNVHWYELPQ